MLAFLGGKNSPAIAGKVSENRRDHKGVEDESPVPTRDRKRAELGTSTESAKNVDSVEQ